MEGLMGLKDILLLGDPRLYQKCDPVYESELPHVHTWVNHLANAMDQIRAQYRFGRGIAAPQLGIMKQLIYIRVKEPMIIINPSVELLSEETTELWDDCMSFPNLLVKVMRYNILKINYIDENWNEREVIVDDFGMSELIQHEVDHLNGILCTMRAIDDRSYKWRPTPF